MDRNRLAAVPNALTLGRIAACPAIFMMALSQSVSTQFWAWVLFVLAGLSDVWDGYLARRYDLITDMGKLLDPFADKLLLAATVLPVYIASRRVDPLGAVPWWGGLPTWVIVVIFGREIFMTFFRGYAARRGVVIAAGKSGKRKALVQSLFVGGILLWYPLVRMATESGWSGPVWGAWSAFHSGWVGITLGLAIVLTLYSMFDYLWSYRTLVGMRD